MKSKPLVIAIALLLLTTAATIVRVKISEYPLTTTLGTNDLFLIAIAGDTNKAIRFSALKTLLNATNVNGSGTSNTLAKWSGSNSLTWIPNGPEGWFLGISNGVPVFMAVIGAGGTTNYFDYAFFTNNFFLSGKGNTLIVTQYVRFPFSTLTLTGTNATAPDLSAASLFKLTLTTNAYIPAPTGLPGTNTGQTINILAKQDPSAIRTLTWNSAYKFPGGTAPTMTTNASAVDVFSFVTSPFDATVLYSVPAQNF
jgi:hypothetical protein